MSEALDQFKQWSKQARDELSAIYLDAVKAQAEGKSAEALWGDFQRILQRSLIIGRLIGQAHATAEMRSAGLTIEIDNPQIEPSEVDAQRFRRHRMSRWSDLNRIYERSAAGFQYAEKPPLLTAPFAEALNVFRGLVPRLKQSVFKLMGEMKQTAGSLVESEQATIIHRIQRVLSADNLPPIGALTSSQIADVASRAAAARVETIYRTNVQTALNSGIHEQLTDREIKPHVALFRLDEIQDRRTRGNPGGLYPDASPHYQMDGFIERPDHPIWQRIWPPNGYNCRASITPISWGRARREGWADGNKNLIESAINQHNRVQWAIIQSGEYPDDGFNSGPVRSAA